jgi:hypothetical protein
MSAASASFAFLFASSMPHCTTRRIETLWLKAYTPREVLQSILTKSIIAPLAPTNDVQLYHRFISLSHGPFGLPLRFPHSPGKRYRHHCNYEIFVLVSSTIFTSHCSNSRCP